MMPQSKQGFVHADFNGRLGRLTDPVVERFETIVDEDQENTLSTIAFLFGNGDPLKLNSLGVQTAMLALYAAGAQVQLTRAEIWELSEQMRRFMTLFQLPENMDNPNGRILRYVFNLVMQRASRETVQCGSKTDLPVGFRLIKLRSESCTHLKADDEKRNLRTIAFQNLHPDPMFVDAQSLAVAMLAIWSCGVRVELSHEQFAELRRRADLLASSPARLGPSYACRVQQARLVLRKADERAEQEGLIEKQLMSA